MKDQKAVLQPHIKAQLLASQTMMGQLADADFKQANTIRKQIEGDNPIILHIEYIDMIIRLLGLPEGTQIHMYVPVGDKALQHE